MKVYFFDQSHPDRKRAFENLEAYGEILSAWNYGACPPASDLAGQKLLLVHARDVRLYLIPELLPSGESFNPSWFMDLVDRTLGQETYVMFYSGGRLAEYLDASEFEQFRHRVSFYPRLVEMSGANCNLLLEESLSWAVQRPTTMARVQEFLGALEAAVLAGPAVAKDFLQSAVAHSPVFEPVFQAEARRLFGDERTQLAALLDLLKSGTPVEANLPLIRTVRELVKRLSAHPEQA